MRFRDDVVEKGSIAGWGRRDKQSADAVSLSAIRRHLYWVRGAHYTNTSHRFGLVRTNPNLRERAPKMGVIEQQS